MRLELAATVTIDMATTRPRHKEPQPQDSQPRPARESESGLDSRPDSRPEPESEVDLETMLPERRFDEDGGAYTEEQFLQFYGFEEGMALWEAARVADAQVSQAVEAAQAAAREREAH